MKYCSIVFLIIISFAFSSKLESHMDSKDFQEIIEDFVEVQKAADLETDLGVVLANLRNEIKKHNKEYKGFLHTFKISCANSRAKSINFIKRLKGRINSNTNNINSFQKSLKHAKISSLDNSSNLRNTQKRLNKVIADRAKALKHYKEFAIESDQKVLVIKELRDLIEDELIEKNSFVQIKDKINSKIENLKKIAQKSTELDFTQIIGSLVEITNEKKFSDQKLLKQVLNLLNKLFANILKFRKQKDADLSQNLNLLKTQERNLESQVREYTKLGESYLSTIQDSQHNIEILNHDNESLSIDVQRKIAELKNFRHLCHFEYVLFRKSIRKSKGLLKVISHASEDALRL